MVQPFPAPPPAVAEAFIQLRVASDGDKHAVAQLGNVGLLPRPWDPGSCPPSLRDRLWPWLDAVAAWINQEYTWRVHVLIPPCWPEHPHIVHELATLAAARYAAGYAVTVEPLEEWHRYALPAFLDRLGSRLGESACRTGRHTDWPAAPRQVAFASPEAERRRGDMFHADARRVAVP